MGGKITVASNVAYPPFEFSPREGPRGFDIDLMNEIGKRAGFEVEYEKVQFDSILRGLNADLFDAAISAMTITKQRETADRLLGPLLQRRPGAPGSEPLGSPVGRRPRRCYRRRPGRFHGPDRGARSSSTAGRVGEIKTLQDHRGGLHGAQGRGGRRRDLRPLRRAEEGRGGRGKIRFVEPVPTGEQYGIAFPKDSPLVDPVNQALAEIKDDGTYEKLYKKWIGMPPEEIP